MINKNLIRGSFMKRITIYLILLLLSAGNFAQALDVGSEAQARISVSGVVVDVSGVPVTGANIREKGTSNGTITDADGKFSLQVFEKAVLVISYIGYNTVEVTVENQQPLTITLAEDTQMIDEVVVIGYGTVRKKDLTGAVGTLRPKDIGNIAVANVENMIQGRIAGVDITNNNGLPGAGTSIKIRGVGTINNSDPLYIVDGMPGSINSVSQYDIESIEILKDASATAIYGARAANGVVLITTKRGQRGAPKVTMNAYMGVSQVYKKLDLLNASQYIDLITEITPTFFVSATRFKPVSDGGLGFSEQWARTDHADIQDEIYRNALQQEYNLNISGGSDNSVYSVSGTYTDMDAITLNYNYGRFVLTSNMEFTIRKFIKIGQNFSATRTNRHGRSVDFTGAIRWAPYMPTVDTNNAWGYSKLTSVIDGGNDTFNPLPTLMLGDDKEKSTGIREQVYIEASILDMFKWRTQLQYTNSSSNRVDWRPYIENGNLFNQATIEERFSYSEGAMVENYLNFNKDFGIHSVNAMIGNTYSSSTLNSGRNITVAGSGSTANPWENYEVLLVTRTPTPVISGNDSWHSAYLSYYGRLNYSLMDKYLFTATYRQDASVNFSPKNRWGRFPSFAFAWKMDEESFMDPFTNISQAKLRLSWGKSGNDRINSYAYLANLFQGGAMNIVSAIGEGQTQFLGTTVNTLPASDIRWETTTSYNAAIDLGFNNNAFTTSIDVYTRLTDGILIRVPIPQSSGIDNSPYSNAAEVRNTGFEFQAGYNTQLGDVRLSVSGVLSYVKNEVVSLGKGEPIMGSTMSRTEKGRSIGEFYGWKIDKVLSTTAEADAYNTKYGTSVKAGDIAFRDIAGPRDENDNPTGPDGRIDDNDRTFLGKSIPPWNYGMNISANYKKFDFQMTGAGVAGSKIYDYTRIFELDAMKRVFNQTTAVLDRWQKEGDVTDVPRAVSADPSNNLRDSERYVKPGSYFRLKNITLGYTVPFTSNKYVDNLRFYVTAQNLLTFTKFDGYNPEVPAGTNTTRGVLRTENMTPIPRTFIVGLQMAF